MANILKQNLTPVQMPGLQSEKFIFGSFNSIDTKKIEKSSKECFDNKPELSSEAYQLDVKKFKEKCEDDKPIEPIKPEKFEIFDYYKNLLKPSSDVKPDNEYNEFETSKSYSYNYVKEKEKKKCKKETPHSYNSIHSIELSSLRLEKNVINHCKCLYIGNSVISRILELKQATDTASNKISRFIDFGLNPEELNVLNQESLPIIEDKFNNAINNIDNINKSISGLQKQLDKMNSDDTKEDYNNLNNKQLDVLKYRGSFYNKEEKIESSKH